MPSAQSSFIVLLLLLNSWIAIVIGNLSRESLNEFKQCVKGGAKQSRLTECLGRSALSFIQRFDERQNVTVVDDDFVAVRSDSAASRSLVNVLDTDPVDFRGILENAGAVMGQRSLEWHMDNIYPGLMFKIGPTADANSVAEFVLDDGASGGVNGERQFGYEDPSTGRLLARQYLLPVLLGLKFNLVALIPLLFAGICLLLKKSLFLVKLAIYVSSFLGLGGIMGSLGGGFGGLGGGFGGGLGGLGLGSGLGIGPLGGQRPFGVFPGKTSVYDHHDELHHQYGVHENQPYKRHDRKIRFEQPRSPQTPAPEFDRFYEYEKQLRHEQSDTEKAIPKDSMMRGFESSATTSNGWQVVDVRSL